MSHSPESPVSGYTSVFTELEAEILRAIRSFYGTRLLAVAVYGSLGRRTPRPDSDIDLFLVIDPLPDGRMPRVDEFAAVEKALAGPLEAARTRGVSTCLSPVFRTPEELRHGSPLLLDMTEDARLLYDRDGILAATIERLRRRLAELGAKRIRRGGGWMWDLKPDYRIGEVFEL